MQSSHALSLTQAMCQAGGMPEFFNHINDLRSFFKLWPLHQHWCKLHRNALQLPLIAIVAARRQARPHFWILRNR